MIIVTTSKLSHSLYHDDDEYHLCQNIMIITIIIHNKCDDESQSQQNSMIMPIIITFLIESSHQIEFDQRIKSITTSTSSS
jgi:hypothetical protein